MLQEEKMKNKTLAIFGLAFFVGLLALQIVAAADFNQQISDQDKQTFDQILAPLMKVYNLIKYTATVIAVVVLLFAGISYITSGGDPSKREQAKNTVMYVVIGLIVIWAAPLVVNFITG